MNVGYAAPSRLYHNFDSGMSTPSPARSPNIQALRDLLGWFSIGFPPYRLLLNCALAESGRTTLRRLSERRLARSTSPNTRSPSLSRPSTVERRVSSITPTPAAVLRKSFESLEQGIINPEGSISMLGVPSDLSTLAAHKADGGPSYPVPSFETVLNCSRKGAPTSAAGIPASTSADVGLRLLLQAIHEQRERSLYLDSEASSEVTTSVCLTLGEPPSFLDDIREYLDFALSFPFHSILLSGSVRLPSPPACSWN